MKTKIIIPYLILFIFTIIFFFKVIFQNPYLYFSADIREQFFPFWVYTNYAFRHFFLPVSDPFRLMGSLPYLAKSESGAFYPINWLFFLLFDAGKNLDVAYLWLLTQTISHYFLGALFFFLYATFGLKTNRLAALIGGVAFGFTGPILGHLVHTSHLNTMIWLPLIFLFVLKTIEAKKSLIYLMITAILLAVAIVSGHQQYIYYDVLFLSFTFLYFLIFSRNRRKIPLLFRGFGIFFFAFMLSAAQIIPTLELSTLSSRVFGDTALLNSFSLPYFLTLIIPSLYGRHLVGYWGTDYHYGNWESNIYIGIFILIFLVFSLFRREKKLVGLFLLSIILSGLLLMGKNTPVGIWAYTYLPLFNQFSMASRISVLFQFSLVSLGVIGFHEFMSRATTMTKRKILLGLVPIIFIWLIIYLIKANFLQFVSNVLPSGIPVPSQRALLYSWKSVQQSFVLISIYFILIVCYLLIKRKTILFISFLVFLFEIWSFGKDFHPIESGLTRPSIYFAENSAVKLIKKDPDVFRVDGMEPRNFGLISHIESTNGYTDIICRKFADILSLLANKKNPLVSLSNIKYVFSPYDLTIGDKFSQILKTSSIQNPQAQPFHLFDKIKETEWVPATYHQGIGEWFELQLGKLVNVSFLRLLRRGIPNTSEIKSLALQFSDGTTEEILLQDRNDWQEMPIISHKTSSIKVTIKDIYRSEIPDPGLREFDLLDDNKHSVIDPIIETTTSHTQYQSLGNNLYLNKEVLGRAFFVGQYQVATSEEETIQKLLSNSFNPRETLLLEEEPNLKGYNFHNSDADAAIITISSHSDSRLSLHAKSNKDGFIFLSEINYPGWKAFVDGKEIKLLNADYAFLALPIKTGNHDVVFIFNPLSVKLGLAISSITAIFVIIYLTYEIRESRTRR